jgi:hypothetical protein
VDARRGENPVDRAVGCFKCHYVSCSERGGRADRGIADIGTNQQRDSQLCPLHLANALAGEPRGVLPASGEPATALGNRLLSTRSNVYHGGGHRSAKTATVPAYGLVMVSGNACPGDRTGASRMAGPG